MADKKSQSDQKLDSIVARARNDSEKRGHGYREQALKLSWQGPAFEKTEIPADVLLHSIKETENRTR